MIHYLDKTDPYYLSFSSQPTNVPPMARDKQIIKNIVNNIANICTILSITTFQQSDIE